MAELDLNELRRKILENQSKGEVLPAAQGQKIVVDRNARIHIGTGATDAAGPITEVNQDTFHGSPPAALREAREFLPQDTRVDMVDGFQVFTYSVRTDFGVTVILGAYFDGSYYQVKLVAPEVERAWRSPHTGHLFEDGRLCLSQRYGGGQRSLREAYAKSVLWAHGISAMIMGAPRFPFSVNNEDD